MILLRILSKFAPVASPRSLACTLRSFAELRPQSSCIYRRTNASHAMSESHSTAKIKNPATSVQPVVLLLPWLGATKAAVEKYENLYAGYGFDTIVHHASLKDFLWPKSGLQSSLIFLRELEQKLASNNNNPTQKVIVHSFSIGCYFYSLMLLQLECHPDLQKTILSNISAQVMDSPVVGTLYQMAIGVGKMLSQNSSYLAAIYKHLCLAYFALTKRHTVKYYNKTIEAIKFRQPKVPSLMMSSKNDPMLIPEALEDFYQSWSKCQPVSLKMWEESGHSQHLRYHPDEYVSLIEDLLSKSLDPNQIRLRPKL